MKRWLYLIALFFITGCATPVLVAPGQTTVGNQLVVDVVEPWSAFRSGGNEIWTQDGPMLQSLWFHAGVTDGGRLYPSVKTSEDNVMPKFSKAMLAPEVMDFFVASTEKLMQAPIKASGLKLARFAGVEGFTFEYSVTTKDEVMRQGIVAGAIHAEKLHLIDYRGAKLHYFGKARAAAESIIGSARFSKAQ